MSMQCLPLDILKRVVYFFSEDVQGLETLKSIRCVNKLFYKVICQCDNESYLSPLQKITLKTKEILFRLHLRIGNGLSLKNSVDLFEIFQHKILFHNSRQHEILLDIKKVTFEPIISKKREFEPYVIGITEKGYFNHYIFGMQKFSINFLSQDSKTEHKLIEDSSNICACMGKKGTFVMANKEDLTQPIKIFENEILLYQIEHDSTLQLQNWLIVNIQLSPHRLLILLKNKDPNKHFVFAFYDLKNKKIINKAIEVSHCLRTTELFHQTAFSSKSIEDAAECSYDYLWEGNDLVLYGEDQDALRFIKIDIDTGEETLIYTHPCANDSLFHIALSENYLVFSDSDNKITSVISLNQPVLISTFLLADSFNGAHLEKDKIAFYQDNLIHIYSISKKTTNSQPLYTFKADFPIKKVELSLDSDFPYILAILENGLLQMWRIRKPHESHEKTEIVIPEFLK